MNDLTPVPQCPVSIPNLSLPAINAMLEQQQRAMSCISANQFILQNNIKAVLRALQEKPNAPVFPTSAVCVQDVVFAFTSDAGKIGTAQTNTSAALQRIDPRAVFFGGDGTADVDPTAETVSDGWEAFRWLINTERAFYVLGDRDLTGDSLGSYTTALFQSYIGGERYYGKAFADADMAVWFYNTGRNESGTITEPDLINVGSAQHQWLQRSVTDSDMGFHILVQHMPPRSIINLAQFGPDVGPEDLGIKLVLTGHSKTNEHIIWNGVHYLNLSTGSEPVQLDSGSDQGYPDDDPPVIYGENAPDAGDLGERWRWGNVNYSCVARITARQRDVLVEVLRVSNGLPVHTFIIQR